MRTTGLRLSIALAGALTTCTAKPLNEPGRRSRRPLPLNETSPKGDAVFLALSGGGVRAAAFAYGVIEEMRKRKLMSRVTYLSTVSGGSFTGAWWALHRGNIASWQELPDLLARGFEARLAPGILKEPVDRTRVAAELYDRELFRGSRFRDLPDGPPYLIINATDMVLGRRFPFTQEQLGCIGSDLGSLP